MKEGFFSGSSRVDVAPGSLEDFFRWAFIVTGIAMMLPFTVSVAINISAAGMVLLESFGHWLNEDSPPAPDRSEDLALFGSELIHTWKSFLYGLGVVLIGNTLTPWLMRLLGNMYPEGSWDGQSFQEKCENLLVCLAQLSAGIWVLIFSIQFWIHFELLNWLVGFQNWFFGISLFISLICIWVFVFSIAGYLFSMLISLAIFVVYFLLLKFRNWKANREMAEHPEPEPTPPAPKPQKPGPKKRVEPPATAAENVVPLRRPGQK